MNLTTDEAAKVIAVLEKVPRTGKDAVDFNVGHAIAMLYVAKSAAPVDPPKVLTDIEAERWLRHHGVGESNQAHLDHMVAELKLFAQHYLSPQAAQKQFP